MKQIIDEFFWMLIVSIISIVTYDNITYKDYNAAIAVIEQIEQDKPDYFYDVLIETEAHQQFKNK